MYRDRAKGEGEGDREKGQLGTKKKGNLEGTRKSK